MAISQGYADVTRNAGDRGSVSVLFGGLLILLVIYVFGAAVGFALDSENGPLPGLGAGNTAIILFRRQDLWWFVFGIAGLLYLRQRINQPTPAFLSRRIDRYWPSEPRLLVHTAVISAIAFAVAGVGAYGAGHGMDLLASERAADFQSLIFREGGLLAPVPADRLEFGAALAPDGAVIDSAHELWGSARPMAFAALRAVFFIEGIALPVNAALSAVSIILLVTVARTLWPARSDLPLIAAILLATSPQFLIGGMTGGAWSAYLCFNLIWLRLYLRGGIAGHLAAALIGAAAALLDHILIHLVFVLPFLVTMLRERRWPLAALYAVAYVSAGLVWFSWYDVALALTTGTAVEAGTLLHGGEPGNATPAIGLLSQGLTAIVTAGIAVLRFIAWQNPAVLPLLYVMFRARKALPPVFRQLVWGCVLSLGLLLVPDGTSGGWGHLPFHGALGGLILLAVLGWSTIIDNTASSVPATRALAMLTAAAILVGIPLRTAQMEGVAGPLAAASRHFSSLDSDVVLVDLEGVPFGESLMSTDPYLRDTPVIVALQRLTPEQVTRLCARYQVDFFDHYDLTRFGIEPSPGVGGQRLGLMGRDRELRAIATSPRCNAG